MRVETWQRLRGRICRIGRAEFLDRSRQEIAKRADVALFWSGHDFTRGMVQRSATVSPNFFFSNATLEPLVEVLRERLRIEVNEIVRLADKICQHRFDLLGFKDLDYGDPVNWHLDAVHGRQSPRKPFYRIRYLDFAEVGDSKVVWELNRHQHLVTLAKAFVVTKDRRYVDEMLLQWRHWRDDNPYPIGINWASSLEVAFRSLSWTWMYYLLEASGALPFDLRGEWLRAQALNGRHIERHLSTYFSPNTHLLGEAVALFFLGILCPELAPAERWKSKGWKMIQEEAEHQVLPDGFHFEQSTYYHVYALDFFMHAAVLASVNGLCIPKKFEETIERMLNALLQLGGSGGVPRFGDDDGGRLFDPRRNGTEHLLDPLATGAILFHRGDFKAAAGALREESIWLFGPQGVTEWDHIESRCCKSKTGKLESSGFYVFAATKPSCRLVVDAGPQGAQSAGHGHADALSICLLADGAPLLIDPGTFEYVGDGPERNRFRATEMHNTLRVDGLSQAEPAGPFSWKSLPRIGVERWIQGESFDYFAGWHDGYTRLHDPVIHRRYIFSTKCGLFLVWDFALGSGQHQLDISWHLDAGLQVRGAHVFGLESEEVELSIIPAEAHDWTEALSRDCCSPVYGAKRAGLVLNFSTVTRLPAEFATLLTVQKRGTNPGVLRRRSEMSSSVRAYHYRNGSREYDFFLAEKGASWKCGRFAADAEFVCLSTGAQSSNDSVVFCHGSYVEKDGQSMLRSKHLVSRCELVVRDGGPQVFCSDSDALE